MINPWILLGVVVAWIGTLAGAFMYGDHVGTATEKAAYQGQQIAALKVANAEIKRLNDAARAKEATQAAQLAVNGADYEKKLQDAEDQRVSDVAAARAGRIILRVPGICPSGSAAPQAAAPAGISDGASDGRLSNALTESLLELADAADRNTEQLSACQAVVQTYTKGTP